MSVERLAFIFISLLVCGQSIQVFSAPSGSQSSAEETPASGKKLSDDDDHDDNPQTPGPQTPGQVPGRYFFGLLDYRSSYGKDFFPDNFLGPEFDRETQVEVDYEHGAKAGQREDEGDAGLQWNPGGELTLAGEFGYESNHEPAPAITGGVAGGKDDKAENGRGFENVDLAVYHPIFQVVSQDNSLDYSAVVRLDAGVPTHTAVSGTDLQLMPALGHLLRVGRHVSVEAWTGAQFTVGPHQTDQFIYGTSLGYQISHQQASLPFIRTVTPLLELDGWVARSKNGQDALFGVAGLNWQLAGKEGLQPRLGLGYVFPIDQGARDQMHWGIITQAFLDF